jgi:glycosyltransferase involved in cell wall biosynthesis
MKGSRMLRDTGLDVLFSGDLARDVPGAEVFVYLSRQEGLGSAVLLAQSCGVPVIASRVGGLPELVEHEVTGLLTGNDPAAVRAAVERLRTDAALRTRLTGEARRRFQERFTVDRMVEATLAVYREVAGA